MPPGMLMDPKMLGLDPKMLGGLDPKILADMGIDPRMLDPKAQAAAAAAFDPKMFGLDPKTMASLASMDPKELAKLDPKMLASLDPSLAAMYASMSGLPGATHNGIATSKAASSPSGSGTTFKAKPGTVA